MNLCITVFAKHMIRSRIDQQFLDVFVAVGLWFTNLRGLVKRFGGALVKALRLSRE